MSYIKRFSDIKQIYSILDINDEYIKLSIDNHINYVYIFKISPLIILNSEDKIIYEILDKYEEFLRGLDIDYQIITMSQEIDINDYFNTNNIKDNDIKINLNESYNKMLKEVIKDKSIFEYSHYLILAKNSPVNNVEKYIQRLDNIVANVERVSKNEEIKKVIMKGVELI